APRAWRTPMLSAASRRRSAARRTRWASTDTPSSDDSQRVRARALAGVTMVLLERVHDLDLARLHPLDPQLGAGDAMNRALPQLAAPERALAAPHALIVALLQRHLDPRLPRRANGDAKLPPFDARLQRNHLIAVVAHPQIAVRIQNRCRGAEGANPI